MSSEGGLKSGGTISGDVTIAGDLTVNGDSAANISETITGDMTLTSSSSGGHPILTIEDTNAGSDSAILKFVKDSASPSTSDKLMQIWAYGDNNAGEQTLYSEIATLPTSVTDGSEEGSMRFRTMASGTLTEAMRIKGKNVNIGSASSAIQATGLHVAQAAASVLGHITIECSANATSGPTLHFAKSRGSVGSKSAINTVGGDILGSIVFTGYDGSLERYGAEIQAISVATSSGSGDMPADLAFFTTPDGTASVVERMRIDDAGRVGIGNSALETWKTDMSVLQIGGDGSIAAKTTAAAGNDFFIARNAYWDSTNNRWEYMSTNGDDEAERLVMANGTYAFDLTGTAGADDAAITFTTALQLDSNSRISLSNNDGGGTSGDSSTTGNTLFGYSINDMDDGSHNNTLIGHKVAGGGTHADMRGNTGVGTLSLYAIASGDNNVAVGKSALAAITSASTNTAVGARALTTITTGSENTVVGFQSAQAFSNAETGNISIGANAMNSFNEGDDGGDINYNVALGLEAFLGGNLDGGTTEVIGNIAIGAYALDATSTNAQTGTVAIGHQSLTALTSGARNTAVGYNAGLGLVDSSDCTLIGYMAGEDIDSLGSAPQECTYIGSYAGRYLDDGSQNTALGHGAMEGGTSGGNSCVSNVAIGVDSLFDITTGDYNTAAGRFSGGNLTTGSSNTLLGFEAAQGLNIGRYNIAIGHQALNSDDVGDRTIAIGYKALHSQNSDSDNESTKNTAVGYEAGFYNVTGTENTYFGYGAGGSGAGSANSHSWNTAIGANALISLTTGNYNTAVGQNALDELQNGSYNVAIGNGALHALDGSEDNNVAIGYNSLNNADGASNNVGIGNAVTLSTAAGTNQIVIGYGATGQQNNSVVLGNADVTDVFMGQDSGALVACSGISFPATQVASGGANALDDYEEGTWTPVLATTGTGFDAITHHSDTGGLYTKVGRVVHFQANIRISALTAGSASGNIKVTGIPFTPQNATVEGDMGFFVSHASGFAGEHPIALHGERNTTNINVYYRASATAAVSATQVADLDGALTFNFHGSFVV